MPTLTGLTFGGKEWLPNFVQAIDQHKCIGCARCFKACGRDVLALKGMNEDGEFIEDEDEDEDEIEKKVMTIANASNCIGCEACSRVCPKSCYTHTTLAIA